jgi:hypothetical protein
VVVVARPLGAVVVVVDGVVVVVVLGAVVVVVVACPPGELDVVGLLGLVVELGLEVDELGFVVAVVVVVDVDVVVVVDGPDVGATETPPVSRPDPTTDDSGFPASSSMHVTTTNATTKTTTVDATSTGHRMRHRGPAAPGSDGASGTGRPSDPAPMVSVGVSTRPRVSVGTPAVPTTSVGATARPMASVTGSTAPTVSVAASGGPTVSVPLSASAATAPVATVSAAGPLAVPAVPLSPNRRRIGASGFLTAAWRTTWWPRSIDWATSVVSVVATMLPMATPITVPATPKNDAMTAAATAPVADARICRRLIFMSVRLADRERPAPTRRAPGVSTPDRARHAGSSSRLRSSRLQ